ncbi:MAG: S-adenosylmethionine synthase [Candidatus Yanofskybacteria bacterium GW2011_GWA2_44_9]|uniref:methionine adenosyltransferase n=1 Tax=Candidatus Yanofskybacteria bacterium GW2011_GWA2_44_9 TaxID=1619025 RepID=A0A0G1KFG7_9BACT|nr:MAG: S-adenosylmethionine synthase [Candidatus Yanofskybacteria bacterium GW2011_GWA2_44_9]
MNNCYTEVITIKHIKKTESSANRRIGDLYPHYLSSNLPMGKVLYSPTIGRDMPDHQIRRTSPKGGFFMSKLKTAESVTSGHPDKICDQISDAILDSYLKKDPLSRVAVEAFGSHGLVVVGGEVTSKTKVPIIMYGYATNETPEFLPRTVVYAHRLAQGLENLRRNNSLFSWLGPDGKTQVTMKDSDITDVLISCQHKPEMNLSQIRNLVTENLIRPSLGGGDYRILINPTGIFTLGGFQADTGLTGRKIMVDTYGGLIPHGGGCFSGKDPSKVDRSAAYMARFVAKNIVANKYAGQCLVSIAYAIGKREPLMIEAETFGTGDDFSIRQKIIKSFNFSPKGIIDLLGLQKPIYQKTAIYGHFGKPDLPWERIVKNF